MFFRFFILFSGLVAMAGPANAQEREVPYWATIRSTEVNMRVGPSPDYKIDWVYRRQGLPVKVIRVMEGWRLVQDPDGTRGWVAARLLSPERGAIVVGRGETAMRSEASGSAAVKWRLEAGVVGMLGECERGWCEFSVGNRSGWVLQERLWGPGRP